MNTAIKDILITLAILAAIVAVIWWQAYALRLLWDWFLEDWVNITKPSIPTLMGMLLMARLVLLKNTTNFKSTVGDVISGLVTPLFALVIGYTIKVWV